MEISTLAQLRQAWYRHTGTTPEDSALTELGESADDVCYLYLTRGIRAAQRFMIDAGLGGRWRKRSAALSWSGTDAADGGRYTDLPADFLRLDGDRRERSALIEADGTPWGAEIDEDQDHRKGSYYYLSGERLWLARDASPPATVYLRYYYTQPAITAATASFDVPADTLWLVAAEGEWAASQESWFPGGMEEQAKLQAAVKNAREEARKLARRTRAPREFGRPARYGNHW